jgi:solute carrier family 30 (zinc transporter), member 2
MKKNKKETRAAMKKLVLATAVSLVFIAAQLYGGYASGSIAVYSDTAHLGSDILGFAISMIALKLA